MSTDLLSNSCYLELGQAHCGISQKQEITEGSASETRPKRCRSRCVRMEPSCLFYLSSCDSRHLFEIFTKEKLS